MVTQKKYDRLLKNKEKWKKKLRNNQKKTKRAKASLRYHKNKHHYFKNKSNDLNAKILLLEKEKNKIVSCKLSDNNQFFTEKNIVFLCILLFLKCGISFRSIPKILEVIFSFLEVKAWIPQETSVMIWLKKISLYKLKNSNLLEKIPNWCAIIDITIKKGGVKLLTILRVPIDIHRHRQGGLKHSEAEVIGVFARDSWCGESIFEVILQLFSKIGYPKQFLLDQGSDINRGIKLFNNYISEILEIRKIIIVHDIVHIFANILKNKYKKNEEFINFNKMIKQTVSKLTLTTMAHLIPPKIRTKGRFQGIQRVLDWAKNAHKYLTIRKRNSNSSFQSRLKSSLSWLEEYKLFIDEMHSECELINKINKIIKTCGMHQKSYQECIEILTPSTVEENIKNKIRKILDKYIRCASLLGGKINVSTDAIESLFGKQKFILERGQQSDLSTTSLYLPAFCGKIEKDLILKALEDIKVSDIKDFSNKLPRSLIAKKIKLPKTMKPKKTTTPKAA